MYSIVEKEVINPFATTVCSVGVIPLSGPPCRRNSGTERSTATESEHMSSRGRRP